METLDPFLSDGENLSRLNQELQRLSDLQQLRADGLRIAVRTAQRIASVIDDPHADVSLRDMNRSLEIVTKTAISADEAMRRAERAEVEATEPERNVVLIILEAEIPDSRKAVMLRAMAAEMGETGESIVFDALATVAGPDRARDLLALEA